MSTEVAIDKPLGSGASRSKRTRKEVISSFRQGHVSVDLKIVTPFDEGSNEYLKPMPKIVFLVDNKYVRMPVDPYLLKGLGSFLHNLGEVFERASVPDGRVDVPIVVDKIREAMNVGA